VTGQQSAPEPDAASVESITPREATGTPTVSDGEQRAARSFATDVFLWSVDDSGFGAGIGAAKRSHRKSQVK
jgi:hypothetical protein